MTTCQLTNEGPQRSPTLSFSVVLAVILIALASFSVLVCEPLEGERQDVPAISRSADGGQPS